ncbi:MAG: hypothetical protein ACPHID_06655 [Thermoplasmatota archaeon]
MANQTPLVIVALFLMVTLSGCFGPSEVPDDALVVQDDGLGLRMSSWSDVSDGRLRLRSLVENVGGQELDIRAECGEPWQSALIDSNGTEVAYREYQEEPGCASYWDVLRPGGHMEFYHSWDFQNHDVKNETTWPAPGGDYVWRLRFNLRNDVDFIETVLPIDVPCSERNVCGNMTQ